MNSNPHVLIEAPADPFVAMRALNRMKQAGFALSLENGRLIVEPLSRLTDEQRAFLRECKAALVQLLSDAETLYEALQAAGAAGLGWHEGTPAEWPESRLLAAGEVLYGDGRMVNRNDRRYATAYRPPAPDAVPDTRTEPDTGEVA